MILKGKNLLVLTLIFGVVFTSMFSICMIGDFNSAVYAHKYDDIFDLCLLLNTNIETGEVDWSGFLECLDALIPIE